MRGIDHNRKSPQVKLPIKVKNTCKLTHHQWACFAIAHCLNVLQLVCRFGQNGKFTAGQNNVRNGCEFELLIVNWTWAFSAYTVHSNCCSHIKIQGLINLNQLKRSALFLWQKPASDTFILLLCLGKKVSSSESSGYSDCSLSISEATSESTEEK